MQKLLSLFTFLALLGCGSPPQTESEEIPARAKKPEAAYLYVLGEAQDAGFPQANCRKSCCAAVWTEPNRHRSPVSLALIDPQTQRSWLFEATPDFPQQLHRLQTELGVEKLPEGIFLSHGHIGHYTGLMFLGREVMGASRMPVYALPRMDTFLRSHGPWSQLVELENIALQGLEPEVPAQFDGGIEVKAILVPHRDEFTETAGFYIHGPNRKALFIPDIDKWDKWDHDLVEEISKVDAVLIDGTFFAKGELPGRDMSEIPHPFVEETMHLLAELPAPEKAKVHFIHFNHTNPLLDPNSEASQQVEAAGFKVAREGMRIPL